MKKIKLSAFLSIFIFCHPLTLIGGVGDEAGLKSVIAAGPILVTATENIVAAGVNFGAEFGVGLYAKISADVAAMGAAVKSAAVAVIAAPATPYVVGGVVVTYGGYKAYRYYNPTPEEVAKAAKCKAEAEKNKVVAAQEKAKRIASKLEYVFKKKLSENLTTARDQTGLPIACQTAARQLAIVAGRERVQAILKDFVESSVALPSRL